jgi:hypothetical protein
VSPGFGVQEESGLIDNVQRRLRDLGLGFTIRGLRVQGSKDVRVEDLTDSRV